MARCNGVVVPAVKQVPIMKSRKTGRFSALPDVHWFKVRRFPEDSDPESCLKHACVTDILTHIKIARFQEPSSLRIGMKTWVKYVNNYA